MDTNAETPVTYWRQQYSKNILAHSQQNTEIAADFIAHCSGPIAVRLSEVTTTIEMGCGTGELSHSLFHEFKNIRCMLGVDLSWEAIDFANQKYIFLQPGSLRSLFFRKYDFADESRDLTASFVEPDLLICSNVLEHFKNPYKIIDRFFTLAKTLLLITPYMQPCTDHDGGEGGAGHIFTFDNHSYDRYTVIDSLLFSSSGWQHRSGSEVPLQLAALITQ